MTYLNREVIEGLSAEAFQSQKPYPWVNIQGTLTPEGFEDLRTTLPDVSLFERMVGVKRGYGQAPHDRAILHYRPGHEMASPWKEFLTELQGESYESFLRRMLGLPPRKHIILTMEWYYAWEGCAVSPHCDARRKLATHLFYFNTPADWQGDWGGEILILDDEGRHKAHSAPEFDELKAAARLDPLALRRALADGDKKRSESGRAVEKLRPTRQRCVGRSFSLKRFLNASLIDQRCC